MEAAIFPHVPQEALKAMIEQEVDILIGLNMNHIMPDGGSGVDKSGGISVKRSIFAPGWVVGGVLPDDQVSEDRHMLSTQAATVRCARLHVVPEPPITPDFWECDQTEDGSFNAMTYSGDTDQEEIDKLGGNIFGYEWNVSQDVLGVKFPVNLSRKKRSVRSEPDMTVADIERLRAVKLTKRNLLGFVNGSGDPLGIGSPWYMKLKLECQ